MTDYLVTFEDCKNKFAKLPKNYYAFFPNASLVEDFLYEAANYGFKTAVKTYSSEFMIVRTANGKVLNLESIRENDKFLLKEIPQENESFLDFRTRLFYYGKPNLGQLFEIKKCKNI